MDCLLLSPIIGIKTVISMKKPLTIARKEYIDSIINATNASNLPAFVIVEVLEKMISEMKKMASTELKRDEALWHKAQTETAPQSEVTDDGRQEDK